jgi:cell wall-associated NlpC family hydrolase
LEASITTAHLRRRLPVAAAAITAMSLSLLAAPAATSATAAPEPPAAVIAAGPMLSPGAEAREEKRASRAAARPAVAAPAARPVAKPVQRKARPAAKPKRTGKRATARTVERHTVKRKVVKTAARAKARKKVIRKAPAIRGGGAVVAYARAQLGKRYVFGQLDCSGLVLRAYKRVGVSLPHKAARQDEHGQRISRSQARPGDLVFWGGDDAYHVAVYIGGGRVIHAPGRGRHVQVSRLWGSHYFVRITH